MSGAEQPLVPNLELSDAVAVLKIFPGIRQDLVHSILNTKGLRAIVIESFGVGNMPSNDWLLEELEEAADRNMIFVNVSQCLKGSVEHGKYESSSKLNKVGVISGFDITTEAAITKLMVLLGKYDKKEDVAVKFQQPLAGELTKPQILKNA